MVRQGIHKAAWLHFRWQYVICLLLVLSTLAVYMQVRHFGYIDYDDDLYVVENRRVQKGLSFENAAWAFKTGYAANWHPVTWLTHLLDVHLYGLNAGAHHLTNLLFHIVNTLLLFVTLRKMTGALWRSALVAALFALHPLHVESVAQVAGRKDVLSTFFWILTMLAYTRYVERPGLSSYGAVCICFMLGLMAKPMLVTLPLVLLLLDYWPLGRVRPAGRAAGRKAVLGLIKEKLPLFVLAAASGGVTFVVQTRGGAVGSLVQYPLGIRAANALVSYVRYMAKTFWPAKLAIFYPHPGTWPFWQTAGALLLLLVISAAVIRARQARPYLAVGWLWYLGTLVPVIGLIQVGAQAMADRYTYVPLTGLFIMVVWGGYDLAAGWHYRKWQLALPVMVCLLALLTTARLQTGYWRNSRTIFSHAIRVAPNNLIAHNNLGMALKEEGRVKEAIRHYQQALEVDANYAYAHNNWGNALSYLGKYAEAAEHYKKAIEIDPQHAKAYYNLGNIALLQSREKGAIGYYQAALRIDPYYPGAHNNIGTALARLDRIDEAIAHFQKAVQVSPGDRMALSNLRNLILQREADRMVASLQTRLAENPENYRMHFELARVYRGRREWDKALEHYQKSLSLMPAWVEALNDSGVVHALKGNYEQARACFKESIAAEPENPQAYYYMAGTYARKAKAGEAVEWLKRAVARGFDDWDLMRKDPNLEEIKKTAYYRTLLMQIHQSQKNESNAG